MTPDAPGPGRRWQDDIGPFLTLGIQLALAVVIFFFLGKWLDGKLGTDPWLTIGGLALGVTGGMIKFFRSAMQLGRRADRAAKEEGEKDGHAEGR